MAFRDRLCTPAGKRRGNAKVIDPDFHFRGLVLSLEPLVTFSSILLPPGELGVTSLMPEYFRKEASLHFLSPSWSLLDRGQTLANRLRQASVELPLARFIVLASDEQELHVLSSAGIEAILGNHNIFIDETVYRPLGGESNREFDAIYNARFSPFKNHHLCKQIERLALIHYTYPGMESNESHVRAMLPHARILNEENSPGTYRRLPPQEVAASVNRAETGLCLSSTEGAMMASMEYLLCGTPVVSIPSQGGRNRYLLPPFAEFAAPDPESVARAVQRLISRRLPKAMVREYMATLLSFERRNFLIALNLKVTDTFGPGNEITDFSPLRNVACYRSVSEWRKELSS
jgi:glycosyltransferase involved in cell wall biosynthesis